jgi:hypothetical protein
MRTEKKSRTKFKGLGEILRLVGEITGGVKLRTDGALTTRSLFVPPAGGPPVLTIMWEYAEPFEKFVFRQDGLCYQSFLEYQENCFLSACGKYVLIKDEFTEIA